MKTNPFRFWLWLIALVGIIVPQRLRRDWRQEWSAELQWREKQLAEWDRLDGKSRRDLIWHSAGALSDALLLQPSRWEDEVVQDLRHGLRMLVKQPGFTIVAVLTLALGIGANTAIFQLLDAVRLRMLPVKAPSQLVQVRPDSLSTSKTRGSRSARYPSVTNPIWETLRNQQKSFDGLAAWGTSSFNLAQGGEVRNGRALWVSGDFFNVLGVTPILGRVFTSSEDQRGCPAPGVVISYPFWQREYGGANDVVGRSLVLADHSFEVIGVTPLSFYGLEVGKNFDFAIPICAQAITHGKNNRLDSGTGWWLMVTGRLKPGVTIEAASAEVQALSTGIFEKTLPNDYPKRSVPDYLASKLEAVGAASGYSILRQNYEESLWFLLAVAGLVLLIACANLANMLLARASSREREMAVRQALGASRFRLVRQLLVESLLLASIGAALGGLLAQALSKFLVAYLSNSGDTVFLNLSVDWRLVGFVAVMALVTCVLFGLVPAFRVAGVELSGVMKTHGRGVVAGHGRLSLRGVLVIVQVGLSLVLVAGAFLFTQSLNNLLSIGEVVEQNGVLIARVGFGRLKLPPENRLEFRQRILERIRQIPGVVTATDADTIPLTGGGRGNTVWAETRDTEQKVGADFNRVGPDYFKTVRNEILGGRDFDARDASNAPPVAIVNEALSRSLFGATSPIGQRLRVEATPSDPEMSYEIVGLLRDSKFIDMREEVGPLVFLAAAQEPRVSADRQLLVRSSLASAETRNAIKTVLMELNSGITVSFETFSEMLEKSLLRERLLATLSSFFGLLALLLASIGLYGILSYGVASRTNEIGVRIALGANQRDVLWLVMREALILVSAGVVLGLLVTLLTARLVASLLYGLSPLDAVSLAIATPLLVLVGIAAGYVPARNATRIDPIAALRHE